VSFSSKQLVRDKVGAHYRVSVQSRSKSSYTSVSSTDLGKIWNSEFHEVISVQSQHLHNDKNLRHVALIREFLNKHKHRQWRRYQLLHKATVHFDEQDFIGICWNIRTNLAGRHMQHITIQPSALCNGSHS